MKVLRQLETSQMEAFRREVYALSRLSHPGLVRVLDEGSGALEPWYAMDFIDGETFDALCVDDTRRAEALRGVRRLCETLTYLHGEGVVHRDLKPANLIVRPGGDPVLVDFGLVAGFATAGHREAIEVGGAISGSVFTMSPEQLRGEFVDARSDLYSAGCLLYQAVTGRPPFCGGPAEVMDGHLGHAPPPLGVTVDPRLAELIRRLLEKRPKDRLGYASDVAAALDAVLDEPSRPRPVGRAYLYRPAMQGRSSELLDAQRHLQAARASDGTLTLLSGESGAGKTRVAMEVTRDATELGMAVVACECVSSEGGATGRAQGAPLRALRPLLRAVADACVTHGPGVRAALLGAHGRVLAEYEAALWPHVADLPEPEPLSGTAARDRVLSALEETTAALARLEPLLLVIDDLQWADELTLAFLHALADAYLRDKPLVVLGTFRPDEAPPELHALTERASVTHHALAPMERGEVADLIRDMLALDSVPEAIASFVAERSEGNPFFISEYLLALVQADVLERSPGGRWIALSPATLSEASVPIPGGVQELVARRLSTLDATAERLTWAAAVLGREFDPAVAAAVAELDHDAAREAVRQLVVGRLIAEAPGGLRFSHDKLREVAYASIPGEVRRAMHARAADAIERRCVARGDVDAHLPEIAHHWSAARVDDRARLWLGRAGERAFAQGAYAEARELLRRAVALDDGLGQTVGAHTRGRWLRTIGGAEFGLGDLAASVDTTRAALAALGVRVPTTNLAWAAQLVSLLPRQLLSLVRTPQRAPQDDTPRLIEASVSATQLAVSYYYDARLIPSFVAVLLGLGAAERTGAAARLADAYSRLGYVIGATRLNGLADRYLREALAYGRASGEAGSTALVLYMDAMYRLGVADWDRAQANAAESAAAFDTIGDVQEAEVARTIGAHGQFYGGHVEPARRAYVAILESARGRANQQHMGWGLFLAARSALAQGDVARALADAEAGYGCLRALPDQVSITMCEGVLAEAALAAGDLDRANAVARTTLARLAGGQRPATAQCLDGYAGIAAVFLTLAERRHASDSAAVARRACAELAVFALAFPMAAPASLRALSRLAALRGWARLSDRLASRSVARAIAMRMPYEQARSLAHRARMSPSTPRSQHDAQQSAALLDALQAPPA